MKHHFAVILAALMALVGLQFIASSPSNSGTLCEVFQQCGDFRHYSPDDGFDDPIMVTCDWNDKQPTDMVPEGESGQCHDVDGVYVGAGRQIACVDATSNWAVDYDATGWHKITDNENPRCVHQLD